MVSSDASESPLTTAAGAVGPETTEAFGLLANETRLAIMLALWEAYDPHAEDNAVGFTELRGRVGIRQGAQFNYHLDKLVGVFVDSTDGGYRLRPVGLNLVQTLIAGTGQGGNVPTDRDRRPMSSLRGPDRGYRPGRLTLSRLYRV